MLHALIAATALALTGPQVGAPAPDFRLPTVAGKTVSLADYRGKTLVVNVWGTWCPPCREETPDLIATSKKLTAAGDVAFLGVDTTEAAPIVRAFVASKGVPYPQAIDADQTFAHAYDIRAFPTTLVIGPDGVLRARFIDNISSATLTGLVAGARAGRDAVIASDAQKKIDALLEPAKFPFTGDVAAVRGSVKSLLGAIDEADNVDGPSDYLRVQAEENALRDAAAQALAPLAATDADRVLLARLQGDSAVARERYDDALAAYGRGLALAPNDPDLLDGMSTAYRAEHDYVRAADYAGRLAKEQPSVDNYVGLGELDAHAGRYDDGAVAYAQAIGLGRAAVQQKPHDAKAIRKLAWAYLYEGRLFALAGRTERARAAFAQTIAWTEKLPTTDARYAMYMEEGQEATVALDAAHPGARTALSLAPWTGPDLPGSVASTYKYRLVVAGTPGKSVALAASGLPARWIASFCSDRQCAPFRTTVAIPESGVKVVEFQLVPESKLSAPATIRVDGDGAKTSVTVGAS